MDALIDGLKLTCQLDNGVFPVNRKELAIDVLNTPEYENRTISFSFDPTLFTRSFHNLIINAFVHGEENTQVSLRVPALDRV